MTLAAAFRTSKYGILLCADRLEDDGCSKREVDKIRWRLLDPCKIFIIGAGPAGVITNACEEIFEGLEADADNRKNVLTGHKGKIESILRSVYKKYAPNVGDRIDLLIVIASHTLGSLPLLYKTEGTMLVPEACYASFGSGKTISDYLASRLYNDDLPNDSLAVLAAFICREAEYQASGVGLGFDMVFIHDGDNCSERWLGQDSVRELQEGIPSLKEMTYSYWTQHPTIPKKLSELVMGPTGDLKMT
jgi:hypothetical protein